MNKVLVTGGAGFIGSHFIFEALKKNWEVYNIDCLNYAANLKNLQSIEKNPNYHFVQENICNQTFIKDFLKKEKFDFIIHFAAETHVDRSIENPNIFTKTNVLGTQTLAEEALQNQVKNFLHISTDEVYGDLKKNDPSFTENCLIKPNSPYSASKASSDLLVLSYVKTFGFNAIVTRCSNNFGPHQDASKLIPVIIKKALKNEDIPIYGDGKNIRDWLYVKDHIKALFLVLEKGKSGEVYNIGGNNEYSNLDLVKIILKILNKPESLISFIKDRPGHDFRYAVNTKKITEQLNWQVSENFLANLEKTVEWYKKIYK